MNDVLSEIPGNLEFRDQSVGMTQVVGKIPFLQFAFAHEDLLYLLGENLVSLFFSTKELGPFGRVVNNLGDLDAPERWYQGSPARGAGDT